MAFPKSGRAIFFRPSGPLCGTNQRKGSFLLSSSASGPDRTIEQRQPDAEAACLRTDSGCSAWRRSVSSSRHLTQRFATPPIGSRNDGRFVYGWLS